jgi:N-acetylglucosaminyldiphosphoundecaprenol N-acetyl-beta-D-mannosaminyltransferase
MKYLLILSIILYMSFQTIISLNISDLTYRETANKIIELATSRIPSYVCFANVHMTIEATDDTNFAQMVNNANLVCADGMPLVKAVKLKYSKTIERVAGMDMMPTLINMCEKNNLSVFFWGTTDEILEKIKQRIGVENPNLKISGMFSPPFKQLTGAEIQSHRKMINESGANMVFVALGCPKQEKWMAENSAQINAVLLGVGGAFPVYAGTQKRAPEWIRNISMEWFYRLIQDPKRLFKRYFYTNTKFLLLFLKSLLFSRN